MIPDLVIKATVLLGIAWLAACLLRGRAASTRHAVWAGLMAATLLLPVMLSVAPSIDVPVLPAASSERPITRITTSRVGPRDIDVTVERGDTREAPVRVVLPEETAAGWQQAPTPWTSHLTPRNLLLGVWLLVALGLALRVAIAHLQARRLLRGCEAPSERLERAAASVAATLGVRAPGVRVSPAGLMPAVIGLRNPAVILPAEASSWTDERLEVVLLHECAHVRRRDAAMQLVSSIATAAYWWHPLAWMAARQIVRERELACDDMVIATGTPAHRYADHLLDIARSLKSSRQPALAALTMARPSQLEGRLIALLDNRRRDSRPARAFVIGLALALAGLAAIAPLKLVARSAAVTSEAETAITPEITHSQTNQAAAAAPSQTQTPPKDLAARYEKDAALYEALMKALKDVDADVRAAAVPVIAHMAEVEKALALLAPLANDVSADVRSAVILSLARSEAPQAADVLLNALDDADPDVRTMALKGLVRLENPSVIPHLAAALKDASEDVRSAALLGINRFDHPQKRALLMQAAADASEDVRSLAALALAGQSGGEIAAVLARLAQDLSADVRKAAVLAIASQASLADSSLLIATLADRDADVRAAAAIALGSIADKAATAGLTRALKDADADVRAAAAMALGSIGDTASLAALTAAVADVDADVRKAAITAAASIAGDAQAQAIVSGTMAGIIGGTIRGTLHGRAGDARRADPDRQAWRVDPGGEAWRSDDAVFVKGEVRNPGAYPWRDDLTAGALIAAAGGLTARGTLRGLTIERPTGDKVEEIEATENTTLKKGDTVVVRRRRF